MILLLVFWCNNIVREKGFFILGVYFFILIEFGCFFGIGIRRVLI